MRFQASLPVRLAILVAGTMLPLIVFSGVLIYSNYLQDRQDAQDRVVGLTRSIRQTLDRQVQGMVSGLSVLASSRALRDDNFEAFRIGAAAFAKQFEGDSTLVVADEQGRIVFNSGAAPGAPLGQRANRPNRGVVFKTGKPAFSPLFVGAVSHQPIVIITVPVLRGDKVIYDLSFNPPLAIFQRIVEQLSPGSDWTISIFDQNGVNFARIPNPTSTIGQRASPTLYSVLLGNSQGQTTTISLEGVPLVTAWTRSDLTGWIAAAGVAESTLTAPALKNLWIALLIAGLLLLIGLGFALRMAHRIAHGEAMQELLINELNHRVKNTLATVQSLASQTFRQSPDVDAKRKFGARLAALGGAHDLLSQQKWEGTDLREVLETVLEPFQTGGERFMLSGGPVNISARCVTMLSMVIHELATNATKYGALSVPEGHVRIEWQMTGDLNPHLDLQWSELHGPPVAERIRVGFGSALIEQGFAAQLGGKAELAFKRTGLVCNLQCPLP
jgi:two-component sensor histidine kinase